MAHRIRWQIPQKTIASLVAQPVYAGYSADAADPACADFNLPIPDQTSYEPETTEAADEDAMAAAELKQITPPNSELLRLAERSPAPEEWYDE